MFKVLKDFTGSPDGCRVLEYTAGQELEISTDFSADLAGVAVDEGWVTEKKAPAKKAPAKKAATKKAKK